jgi:hypothetical protein
MSVENEWGIDLHTHNWGTNNRKFLFGGGIIIMLLVVILFIRMDRYNSIVENTKTPIDKFEQSPGLKQITTETINQSYMSVGKTKTVSPTIYEATIEILTSTDIPDFENEITSTVSKLKVTPGNQSENCLFPCWLGIEPDVTTVDEARDILLEVGNSFVDFTDDEYFFRELWSTIEYTDGTNFNSYDIAAVSKDNATIDGIYLYIDREKQKLKFGPKLRILDIAEIFATYGNPEKISVYSGSYGSPSFRLWVYYPDFLITYEGIANNITKGYQICPRIRSGYLRTIVVYTFGKDKSFSNDIHDDIELYGYDYQDFTQTTGKSLDEIRAIFGRENGEECIKTFPILPEQ